MIPLPAADRSPAPASRDALETARFREAWAVSRGAGVTVAVISSDAALAEIVTRAAPEARVLVIDDDVGREDPSTRLRAGPGETARASPRSPRRRARDDATLAERFERAEAAGARVVLLALARSHPSAASERAVALALARGVFVVAPTGDEGLSHERFPAAQAGVVSVAALSPEGCLAPGTNAGALTLVAAPVLSTGRDEGARGSFAASALVAGALALALSLDETIRPGEVAAALSGGALVETREEALGPRWLASDGPPAARPARLDARALQERLRPRSRAFALRGARVTPAHVPAGERAWARVSVLASGRLPARGTIEVALGTGASSDPVRLRLRFGPLEPCESVELEGELSPSRVVPARPLRTPGGGALVASPLVATFRAGGNEEKARFDIVPPDQSPPGARLLSLEVERGLLVRATIENAAAREETDAFARLVATNGSVLAETSAPALRRGESATLALQGRVAGEAEPGPADAWLEVGRRPRGFKESVEARVLLALDPAGAPLARRSRRR
ncbi:hypothetical protein HY251_12250 [bacterium]|nr:hypothetical protein [bacterium]